MLHSNEGLRQVVIRESQTLEIKAKVGLGTLVPIRDAIFKPDASGVWFTAGADGFWSFSFGDELPRQFSTRNAFSGPLQIVSNQSKLIHGHDVISVFHLPSLEFERELVDEGMGRVYDICELTDQGLLASSHQDRFVRLWNIQNGKLERKLGPLGGEARVLSYDSSTKRLAVGCRNREVIVFDSQAFTVVERIRGFAGRFAMSYEKEGSLVYGAYGNALRATRGGTASNTRIHLGGWVAELLFDGRGRLIARSNVDQNEISIIDVESLTVRRVKLPGDRIRHLADSVIDEATIIAVDVNASQIIAYDLLTEELKHRIEFPEGSVVSAIALDANTRSLCLGFSDGRVAFVDLSKVRSKIQFCLDQHSNLISAATAIGNGTFATADSKSRVLLWKDGKVIDRKTSFGGKIEALASFNRTLAVGLHADVIPENNSFLFPEATKQECIRLPGHAFQVEDMKFIENGATLVSIGGDREIKILDLELREPRLMIQDDEIYTSMAISPGEEIIAAGTREGSVILYRAPNKETLPID
ncbi:MAG: WD40 repeat domain-containing protein [Aureliella sp.]